MYCMFATFVVMSTHYHYMGVLGVNQSILLINVLKKRSKKKWGGTSRCILLAPNLRNANCHPYNDIADNT